MTDSIDLISVKLYYTHPTGCLKVFHLHFVCRRNHGVESDATGMYPIDSFPFADRPICGLLEYIRKVMSNDLQSYLSSIPIMTALFRYFVGDSRPARKTSDRNDFRGIIQPPSLQVGQFEIVSGGVSAELESQNASLRKEIKNINRQVATAEEISRRDDRIRADLESYNLTLQGEMALKSRQVVIAEEKLRRQNESHEEEKTKQEAVIEALLGEIHLLSNQLENKAEYTMDDTACEALTREIFHLLTTWCFSNFKVGAARRTEIQSEIGRMLACEILSPLVLGLHAQQSQVLDMVNWNILTSVPKYDEHRWRVTTHACCIYEDKCHVETWHAYIESGFGGIADQRRAENRGRVLRKILEKAVCLQKQLHVQQSRYIVQWISGGTPFSAEHMQIQGVEVPERRPRVVQYCLEPLITKAVYCREAFSGTAVIVRATVVCIP